MSNERKASIARKIAANTIAGASSGSVMRRQRRQPPGAVHREASKTSRGRACSRANTMTITNGVHCQESTRTSVTSASDGSPSQSGCGKPELAQDPVDHPPVRVEQGPPHQPDDDRRQQHRQDEHAADEPRPAQMQVEEQGERGPEDHLDGDRPGRS